MIWLVWRQYRTALITIAFLLLLLATVMIFNYITYETTLQQELTICMTRPHSCPNIVEPSLNIPIDPNTSLILSLGLVLLLPLTMGIFLGAPLIAREQEQRTHYFAWLQSVSRGRWLAIKLGLLIVATLLGSGLLSIIATWGNLHIHSLIWTNYAMQGPILPGYALLALTLGVAAGAFVHRTLPAMALTFVLYLALFIGLSAIFPYLLPPLSAIDKAPKANITMKEPINELVVHMGYTDQQGHEIREIGTYCGFRASATEDEYEQLINQCIKEHHIQWRLDYQPPERFWPLQWIHAAVLLVISGILVLLTFWRLRQRRM
ncbi:hypothetical protein EPA93_36490 [Ktedonosporobacter rubrisoli]|uniref:ABC transporter permease n=1 Tax=Ktedonosporobacter rubrisoli TaxID=2509675 RepID=A0A4V0YZW9_KTERU|nr:hypothetical protein [Ktedonosporobacter rubrisoli]QBD81181.1 hypothetical protein EPA93_36490 [Ktedonosporobacter rubrisoli]